MAIGPTDDRRRAFDGLIGDQRAAFDVPADVAYFNTASLAPQLRAVRATGQAALERRARPWTISASDWVTDVGRLRALFASIIGSRGGGGALVPPAPHGLAGPARHN